MSLELTTYPVADDEPDTYCIVRFYRDPSKEREIIDTGLTLDEAKAHCNDSDSEGEGWFDGFEKE